MASLDLAAAGDGVAFGPPAKAEGKIENHYKMSGTSKEPSAIGLTVPGSASFPTVFTQGELYKLKWVPDGIPLLRVNAGHGDPSEKITGVIEEQLKKNRGPMVIHYEGGMLNSQDQTKLKDAMSRRIFTNKNRLREDFVVAVAVPNGIPKMGLIFLKRGEEFRFEWTTLDMSRSSTTRFPAQLRPASSAAEGKAADAVAEVMGMLGSAVASETPRMRFTGAAWRPLQDPLLIAKR